MIVTITSFHKSLAINTLAGIIGFYDNKDNKDFVFCAIPLQ
jgi:hypothetical protein